MNFVRQVIARDELARGFTLVEVGSALLPNEDWHQDTIVSRHGDAVRLVLLVATNPGAGALTSLLARIKAAGLRAQIIAPTRSLADALLRRGWSMRWEEQDFASCEDIWEERE